MFGQVDVAGRRPLQPGRQTFFPPVVKSMENEGSNLNVKSPDSRSKLLVISIQQRSKLKLILELESVSLA